MGVRLAVAEQESELFGGYLKSSYVLRPESNFGTQPMWNYGLIGESVSGRVLESNSKESRLQLSTDGEGEPAESWHKRPVFYAGGGRGYGGRPENGDTLYLYFPTEREEDRTVIGGAGAGYEKLLAVARQIQEDTEAEGKRAEEADRESRAGDPELELIQLSNEAGGLRKEKQAAKSVDAASLPGFKNWSTPGKQGLSLNETAVRFQNGGGNALSLGGGGILFHSKGDVNLKGKNGLNIQMLKGKQISLCAKEYIYLNCGMSEIALLPQEVHIQGIRVFLDSPENEDKGPVYSGESIEKLKNRYYQAKWGSPLQLFMPDGTVIGRVDGLEGNAALRKSPCI